MADEVDNRSAIGGVGTPSLVNNTDADAIADATLETAETALPAAIHQTTAGGRAKKKRGKQQQNPPPDDEEEPPDNFYAYEGNFDFEVVGLESGSNGRTCCQHLVACGKHLLQRDVVRLVKCVVNTEVGPEEAIKLVRIMDGNEGCTVGFIPRVQANLPNIKKAIDSYAQVMDIYKFSENATKKFKSKRNQGMCCCVLLNEVQQKE